MRFERKVVIVTGGGSGIGKATAELFAQEGARVVVADAKAATAEETAANIRKAGAEARSMAVDVSRSDQVQAMVENTIAAYGRIDVLFNNAGMLFAGNVVETREEDWNRLMAVNLGGVYLCSKAVIPHMAKQGGGAIINASSSTGNHDGIENAAAYVASKGGVTLLTKCMALDHIRDGIRVNAVAPGPTETPILRSFFETDEQMRAFGLSFPMKRLGVPVEIAHLVLFLASAEASYINGSVVAIDGGQTARV